MSFWRNGDVVIASCARWAVGPNLTSSWYSYTTCLLHATFPTWITTWENRQYIEVKSNDKLNSVAHAKLTNISTFPYHWYVLPVWPIPPAGRVSCQTWRYIWCPHPWRHLRQFYGRHSHVQRQIVLHWHTYGSKCAPVKCVTFFKNYICWFWCWPTA